MAEAGANGSSSLGRPGSSQPEAGKVFDYSAKTNSIPSTIDLFRDYPELEPEDIRQALAFAAASLEDSAAESNAA